MSRNEVIGSNKIDSPSQLLDVFHSAAIKCDLKSYFGCFDPAGRFLGTDPKENWHVNEFYDYAKPYFIKKQGWSYKLIEGTRKIDYFPNTSSSSSSSSSVEEKLFCIFDELLLNDAFGTCRGSGTLIYHKDTNAWFIASYHLTFPIPNEMAHDITVKIKKHATKLQEIQSDLAMASLIEEEEKQKSIALEKKNNSNNGSSSSSSSSSSKKSSKSKIK